MEAQRLPGDFDGIVAGAPANYWTHLMSGIVWSAQATHKDQPGNLPLEKLTTLHDEVVRACDGLDGVRDGVLEDPTRCKVDLKRLACTASGGTSCLSSAHVEGAAKRYAGPRNPRTQEQIFPGVAPRSELAWDPVNGPQPFGIAESYYRHVAFNDVKWDYRTLDFDANVAASDKTAASLINATDPNLRPFFARGGKPIEYHGWDDQQISPFNSVNYYKSVEARLGGGDKGHPAYRPVMG